MTKSPSSEQFLSRIVIAIDGPSGSGKTTTAREVARRLRLHHVDTGAMYRAVTLKALRSGLDLKNEPAVCAIAESLGLEFEETGPDKRIVRVDGEDVTLDIRSVEVTRQVSLVSSYGSVRRAMVRRQRAIADRGGVVLEGRDIGTVVLPGADVKIYVDASADVRAERRQKELRERGEILDVATVRESILRRDRLDSTRAVSPLKIPVGACVVDTSQLTIEEQVGRVIDVARRTAERLGVLASPGRNDFRRERLFWISARMFIRAMAGLFWGLSVKRKEPWRHREPFIYASNHKSNIDPPLVTSTIKGEVHFVAKVALFKNPLLRALITWCNALPIRRGTFDRAALDVFLKLLAAGRSVLIFPEGGRVAGDALGPAKPGVGYLALNSGVAVVPIYVHGTNHLGGGLLRRPRMRVMHGRPIRLTDTDLDKYRNPDKYRDFGDMVMAAIAALKDEHDHPRVG